MKLKGSPSALNTPFVAKNPNATVKANAYGIGDKPVVKSLIKDGCKIFFVAHFSEAV